MGEAVGTILRFIAVVAFIGTGAYAVLSIADFRAARRGFWATAILLRCNRDSAWIYDTPAIAYPYSHLRNVHGGCRRRPYLGLGLLKRS